jgi:radical SAM protein with 4Fe4S-binding SPASM domain
MSASEIIRFLDLFAESGCLWLNFSGGEPFMRDDFLELYSHAKSKGFLTGILTNATKITKEVARALADDPPLSIDVTIYGASSATYEKVTGVSDGFTRCLEGVDNLLEAGVTPHLQTCVSVLNKDDIPLIKKLAEDRKLKYHYDPHIHPRIDGDKYPVSLRVSPQEVCEMMLSDISIHKRLKEYLDLFVHQPHNDALVKCGMLYEGFWVDPYGRLRICAIIPKPVYNLRAGGSLREAWNMFNEYIASYKVSEGNSCLKCDISFFCMQCPAWSELHHDDWNKKVDYLCEIAHLETNCVKELGLWPEK